MKNTSQTIKGINLPSSLQEEGSGMEAFIISIGCNKDYAAQMNSAKECLAKMFPGISFTSAIVSPAYGMDADAPNYSNMLAKGTTSLSLKDLKATLKSIEKDLGDTPELRQQGIVMMDLDLLQYDEARYHLQDWERPYIKKLLTLMKCVIILFVLGWGIGVHADKNEDKELLGKAVEYYQGGKYHECVLAFEKLQQHYKLNARFKAYLGMSYYKDMDYEKAADNLKAALPDLTAYSPKEQAVYNYSCAESLFNLGQYKDAIGYYDKALPLTENPDTTYVNYDKSDVIYHTAFSYYMLGNIKDSTITDTYADSLAVKEVMDNYQKAYSLFSDALQIYNARPANPNDELHTARIAQINHMLTWLKLKNTKD